jgi:hypothetical protein
MAFLLARLVRDRVILTQLRKAALASMLSTAIVVVNNNLPLDQAKR